MAAPLLWLPAGRHCARSRVLLAAGGALFLLGACGSSPGPGGDASGDTATWELIGDVTADSRTLEIGVTRLGCAGGVTGEVLVPEVTYEEDRIVVEVDVAPIGDGAQDCQGNDVVPVTVALDDTVGQRQLVDGACLEGEAATTSFCESEVRWP